MSSKTASLDGLAQFDRTTSIWGPITLGLGFLVSLAALSVRVLPTAVLRLLLSDEPLTLSTRTSLCPAIELARSRTKSWSESSPRH